MDSIGAEVGLKMRSAIKAKLLELNCYVDDELPDYIMVMVANKRSKSQMTEDLNLFLSAKTSLFVDWLHIVLKKLKEVTVTNPDIYKKIDKQKSGTSDLKIKKEKKSKKFNVNIKSENSETEKGVSLTDNLLITPSRLTEHRKIIVNTDDTFDIPLLSEVTEQSEADLNLFKEKLSGIKSRLGLQVESDDDVTKRDEIPENETRNSLSSSRIVQLQSENTVQSDENKQIKHSTDQLTNLLTQKQTKTSEKRKHTPITFEKEEPPTKKISVLERLGKKATDQKRIRTDLSEFRKDDNKVNYVKQKSREEERYSDYKERGGRAERNRIHRSKRDRNSRSRTRSRSPDRERTATIKKDAFRISGGRSERKSNAKTVLSRLGVMSTIHVPQKDFDEAEFENELKTKDVRSMVQVKPRVIPPDAQQPNKNLLLKAVAEAHRSVAQATKVGLRLDLSPRKFKLSERLDEPQILTRKLSDSEKTKLRNIILSQVSQSKDEDEDDDDDVTGDVYVPKPLHRTSKDEPKYIPSSKHQPDEESSNENVEKQKIIVTLENQKRTSDEENQNKTPQDIAPVRKSAKLRLQGKRSPSPIIFDKVSTKISTKVHVPDKLPVVRPPLSIKNKERCKYWPSCRQGDKCEFVHPNTSCEMFPNCKFGDKCLFLHPVCKFGTSCTKKDCPYSHTTISKTISSRGTLSHLSNKTISQQQNCKYFPNCINVSCPFYHPKPCKFGKYCKNQANCTFSHTSINTSNLTWRSK